MGSNNKSRFLRLPILLGGNIVFVLFLGASAFEVFQNQQKILVTQESKLQSLNSNLDALREKQKNYQEDSEHKRYSFVSDKKLARMLEQQEQANLQQRQKQAGDHEALRQDLEQRFVKLTAQQRSNQERAMQEIANIKEQSQKQGEKLERYLKENKIHFKRALHASVRINAKSEVGSGIVIFNGRRGSRERLETYILTAFHVIKDNLATKTNPEQPIDIDFYKDGQKAQSAQARIVETEIQQDLALLRVTTEIIAVPALLAQPQTILATNMFSKVLTIGCPLGYSPMPTHGEITSTTKTFDEQDFWMINAPTIFGNSGGGVFDEKSGALLGVLIRIAAYKNVIDVAVPHLGIVTPLDAIKTWLKKTKRAFIFEPIRVKSAVLDASRKKD
ncbi:MAG: trypsin-like peptidase domain-containing protein [Planctomycetota bacterium]|nr:trypsin-like peptidase domain-containing protein [Planctomycetota bacterium]